MKILILIITLILSTSSIAKEITVEIQKASQAFKNKDYLVAESYLKAIVKLKPNFAESWVMLGASYAKQGKKDEAKRAFEKALSIHQMRYEKSPNEWNQLFQQAIVLILLNRIGEADKILKIGRKKFPRQAEFKVPTKELLNVRNLLNNNLQNLRKYDKDLFVHYKWCGGKSPIRSAEVKVYANGLVEAKFTDHKLTESKHLFNLNKKEFSALHKLVASVDFFQQPEKDTQFVTDIGQTTIMVSDQGKRRTLVFRYRPSMLIVTNALRKLANHTIIVSKLEKGDSYGAMVACSPNLVGEKVYSSSELKIPLQKFIISQDNRQKVEWALSALSWITSPKEWITFLTKQINQADTNRKSLLLGIIGSHPFYSDIPQSHLSVELPYLTQVIRAYAKNRSPIDKKIDDALGIVCQLLGHEGNVKSLPALRDFVATHSPSGAGGWANWAIQSIKTSKNEKNAKVIKTPEIIRILEPEPVKFVSTTHSQQIKISLDDGRWFKGIYVPDKAPEKYRKNKNLHDILNLSIYIKKQRQRAWETIAE